jgi:para-nitrobenzyl esterase
MAIVDTRSGKVEGLEHDGIFEFRGIPFAEPPVGPLRWLAPRREARWDGVRDATRFSAQSAQGAFAMDAMMGVPESAKSEDSLYLNVFTPGCDDARRPVMVWIHGGAFMFGTAATPWYDGTKFCRNGDVVVVTVNYRLGPFGYLHLADLFGDEFEGSGNAAVLDHVAALEWVRDSIVNFGGDPDQVTIFGESAGGGSVGTLLGLPAARGLFHGAIAQSGAASWVATRESATEKAAAIVEALQVKPGDVDALRHTSTDDVLTATAVLNLVVGGGTLPYQPVVDGTVLPQPPLDAIAAGNAAGVRVLAGTNRHEMTLFNFLDASLPTIDDTGIDERLRRAYPGAHVGALVAEYRARRPDASGIELWTALATDSLFRIPANLLSEAQLPHGPAWMYWFTWETPAFGGILRSTHALEIPFVFDNLHAPGSNVFLGDGPESERRALADAMHRAWVAFARDGDPGWPAYETATRPTMRFDARSELVHDPDGDDRRSWSATFSGS